MFYCAEDASAPALLVAVTSGCPVPAGGLSSPRMNVPQPNTGRQRTLDAIQSSSLLENR